MNQRIQLSRVKGFRLPAGAINCARPGKFGNPYKVDVNHSAQMCVDQFRSELVATIADPHGPGRSVKFKRIAASTEELRGHDLACWCALDAPCHVSVYLEVLYG